MKKPIEYYSELYRVNVAFFVGWKFLDYQNYCEKKFKFRPNDRNRAGECSFNTEQGHCIVYVRHARNYWDLAHECLHAVNMIFEYVGIQASLENDEAQAYLLTHLMKKALGK